MAEVLAIISLTGRSHCDKPGTPYIGVENNLAAFRRLDPNWIANTPEDSRELAFTSFWNEYYWSDGGFPWMDGNDWDTPGTPSYLKPPTNGQTSQDFGLSWESLIGNFSLNLTSNEPSSQANRLTFSPHPFNFTQGPQTDADQSESTAETRRDHRPAIGEANARRPETLIVTLNGPSIATQRPVPIWNNDHPNMSAASAEATSGEKPIRTAILVPGRVYKLRGNLVLMFLFLASSSLLVVTWILWVWRAYKSRRDFETFVSLLREGEPVTHQLSGNRRRSNRNKSSYCRATHKLRVHVPDAPVETRFRRIYRFFYWNLLSIVDIASGWNQKLRCICEACVCRWRDSYIGPGWSQVARPGVVFKNQSNESRRRMNLKLEAQVEITYDPIYAEEPDDPPHKVISAQNNHSLAVTSRVEISMVASSRIWSKLLEQVRVIEPPGRPLLPWAPTAVVASNPIGGEVFLTESTVAIKTMTPSESSSSIVPSNSPPPGFEFLLQEQPYGSTAGVWGSSTASSSPSLPKHLTSSPTNTPSSQIRRDLGAMIYVLTGETLTPEAIEMLINADRGSADSWNLHESFSPQGYEWAMDANAESL